MASLKFGKINDWIEFAKTDPKENFAVVWSLHYAHKIPPCCKFPNSIRKL